MESPTSSSVVSRPLAPAPCCCFFNAFMVEQKKSRLNGLKKRKLGSGKGGKQQLGRDKRKRRRL